MSVPGSNLLKSALQLIASQTILYYRYRKRATNEIGLDVATYEIPRKIRGSLQPLSSSRIAQLGLDMTKRYFVFYGFENFVEVGRNVSGDQFTFGGKKYQCLTSDDWFLLDGWAGILAVEIGAC